MTTINNTELEGERDELLAEYRMLRIDSRGVDGLHLNGTVADWGWLEEHDWLSLHAALIDHAAREQKSEGNNE